MRAPGNSRTKASSTGLGNVEPELSSPRKRRPASRLPPSAKASSSIEIILGTMNDQVTPKRCTAQDDHAPATDRGQAGKRGLNDGKMLLVDENAARRTVTKDVGCVVGHGAVVERHRNQPRELTGKVELDIAGRVAGQDSD